MVALRATRVIPTTFSFRTTTLFHRTLHIRKSRTRGSLFPDYPMATTTSSQTPTVQNKLQYLLVLDFEATCGDAVPYNEIIEFPTIVYNLQEEKVQATFHEYVRPVDYPKLTTFCTDLTGITQVSLQLTHYICLRESSFCVSSGHCRRRGTFPSCLVTVPNVHEGSRTFGRSLFVRLRDMWQLGPADHAPQTVKSVP